jgi:hypothetical protein
MPVLNKRSIAYVKRRGPVGVPRVQERIQPHCFGMMPGADMQVALVHTNVWHV